eukprot:6100611-Prymnesium_polylepis.2
MLCCLPPPPRTRLGSRKRWPSRANARSTPHPRPRQRQRWPRRGAVRAPRRALRAAISGIERDQDGPDPCSGELEDNVLVDVWQPAGHPVSLLHAELERQAARGSLDPRVQLRVCPTNGLIWTHQRQALGVTRHRVTEGAVNGHVEKRPGGVADNVRALARDQPCGRIRDERRDAPRCCSRDERRGAPRRCSRDERGGLPSCRSRDGRADASRERSDDRRRRASHKKHLAEQNLIQNFYQ